MILNRDKNKIGYINKDLFVSDLNSNIFNIFSLITIRLKRDIANSLKISCFQLPDQFLFPDISVYEDDSDVFSILDDISSLLRTNNHRIIFFLPTYYYLGSLLENTLLLTRKVLVSLYLFLEALGIKEPSIIIRIGSAYGSRKTTMDRFCNEIKELQPGLKEMLTICNDDKPSLFSVTDIMSGIYYKIGIPICFRFLPHHFNTGGLSVREALFLSASTWPIGTNPILIHSESSRINNEGIPVSTIPSDFLSHRIPTFGLELDIILDSPVEEECCLRYRKESVSLKPIIINKQIKK